ncbi:MAG: sigma-54 dependent transcriptional regulator [Thermodesulfobacteriota bacterium]
MKPSLLIVDDERDMLKLLQRSVRTDIDCEIYTATDALAGLHVVETHPVDVALLDIRMPRIDGLELLERIKAVDPLITVIMMTAYGVIEVAVDSIKKGAYDFITKPFEHETLIHLLTKAFERSRLLHENRHLQKRIQSEQTFQNLVGMSPAMQRVYDTIQMVAHTDVTVLITGESGTGKNLAARAIHAMSRRSTKPYVHVNCPTLPESILESELFGYKKGAFTHAMLDRKGLIEDAEGGTLCLDEIGDIPLSVQTKLLQVLEEKQIKPLGQTASIQVDVRLIASTNCDLREKIAAKQFREDLFYRLNVVNLHMPPLRDRREDIPLLAHYFLKRYNAELDRDKKGFTPELMQLFLSSKWEGNVRELANLVKRGVVLAPEDMIRPEDIGWKDWPAASCLPERYLNLAYRTAKQNMLEDFHNHYFENLLQQAEGNVTRAAQICGLERQHLQQILRKYRISAERFR